MSGEISASSARRSLSFVESVLLQTPTSTAGFWQSTAALPSKPRLICGDRAQFKRDLVRAKERTANKIERCTRNRYMLQPLELWPEWWFDVQNWGK